MGDIPSFGKIFRVGSEHIPDLFDGRVEITEKIDGSLFAFGVSLGGELVARSKGLSLDVHNPENDMFGPACSWVRENEDAIRGILLPGDVLYGETLSKPKHNVLAYDSVPPGNIIVFGAGRHHESPRGPMGFDESLDVYATNSVALGLMRVSRFWFGKPDVILPLSEWLERFLENESILGGTKVEGIVIKNPDQAMFMGEKKHMVMGKLVRDDFKEKHKQAGNVHGFSAQLESLIMSFRSEARWEKAIQRLAERGTLENDVRDIGPLLKEISTDLREEEAEDISAALFKMFWSRVAKQATIGFPEWYKARLFSRIDNPVRAEARD